MTFPRVLAGVPEVDDVVEPPPDPEMAVVWLLFIVVIAGLLILSLRKRSRTGRQLQPPDHRKPPEDRGPRRR